MPNRTGLPGSNVWHALISPEDWILHYIRNLLLSYLTLLYLTLPYLTLPYLTLPYLTVPYRTVPYRTVPYRTVPYRTVPYRTVPYLTLQQLHVYRGPGGTEHASPLASRHQGSATHHRGRRGQLPRDDGIPPDRSCPANLPRPLDTHQPIHWWEHTQEVPHLRGQGLWRQRRTRGLRRAQVHPRLPRRRRICKWRLSSTSVSSRDITR